MTQVYIRQGFLIYYIGIASNIEPQRAKDAFRCGAMGPLQQTLSCSEDDLRVSDHLQFRIGDGIHYGAIWTRMNARRNGVPIV